MTVSDDLWNFTGAHPAYYSTQQITLTVTDAAPGSQYIWTITNSNGEVSFLGGGTVYTGGATATLQSLGVASPAGQPNDIQITVKAAVNGVGAGIVGAVVGAVPRPDHLVHVSDVDTADATWGYDSKIYYRIMDQFNDVLPRQVDINEQWTTGVVPDFMGMDWRRGNAAGASVNPANWYDDIQGETAGHTPAPQNPPMGALGNTKVYHWGQAWFVGSQTPGQGTQVQVDTFQKYQDHARHL